MAAFSSRSAPVDCLDDFRNPDSTQIDMRTAEKDNIAEAINHVLREVRAARRDLQMTGFCLQQAEAFRRIDRAKASLLDLVECRNRQNKHSPPM